MTVFKAFAKVVKKYIGTILLYTGILIIFGISNMQTSDNSISFQNSKPDILIINEDTNNVITNNLIKYISKNSNLKNIEENDEAINDALFYRDINYIIYIPKNYGKDVLNNLNPRINIKSTGDYQSSLAEMLLSKYIQVQNVYNTTTDDGKTLVDLINKNLSLSSSVELTSSLDSNKIEEANFYFNFASYSILAVIILVICLVLNSFNEKAIHKRTVISSMNYKKFNRQIILASLVYVTLVWLVYSLIATVILGDIVFTTRGLIYILNLLLYSVCSLTIAMLISSLVSNKNAINGVVNVVALGSAFLCGAFVPADWLPDSVLKIAHVLPAYWYINSNELLSDIETLNLVKLKPIMFNFIILILFTICYIFLNNIITKRKMKD